MGSFNDYLEDALVDHVFGTGHTRSLTYTQTTKYIALCTARVTDSNTGTTIDEPAGGSYARVRCRTWDKSSGGATENSQDITFPTATAGWGKILDFAICDTLTTGNVLAYGSLTVSKVVQTGDTPKFSTGDIDITLN